MRHIKLFENFKEDLEDMLVSYSIENYIINDDGTIDVNGDVDLYGLHLKKIPFKFGKVLGNFKCNSNELESLEGCPYYVGRVFNCSQNNLHTLIGSPKFVGYNFICRVNYLKDLIGSPIEVCGSFLVSNNDLKSLEGMTSEIGSDFNCYNNRDLKELDSVSNIEGNIYCDKHVDTSKFSGYCKVIIKN